jgi:biotin carboxyl carrier protein
MKYEVLISGRTLLVELERQSESWQATISGESSPADVAEIAPNTFSVLMGSQSQEICVAPEGGGKLSLQTGRFVFTGEVIDPRSWRGRRHTGAEAEGRQQIVAPMPGKVVRVLVRAGEKVEVGQGLLVIEAMKMQNEIRSPKGGMVERVLVGGGQAVNAGQVLCVVG